MARKNTLTRFLEDIIDNSKDLVDDLIDRAKDVEDNAKDAVVDVVDDDDNDGPSPAELSKLQSALADLTAKVSELSALQQQSAPPRTKATTSSS